MGVFRTWHVEKAAVGALVAALLSASCSVIFDVEWTGKGCPQGQHPAAGPGCLDASATDPGSTSDAEDPPDATSDAPLKGDDDDPAKPGARDADTPDAEGRKDAEGGAPDTTVCTVGNAVAQGPYGGNPVTVYDTRETTIEAEYYDIGGEGVSYHDTTVCNVLGRIRTGPNEGVDVEQACGGAGSTCADIAATEPGEWAEYTINVTRSGMYAVTLGDAALAPSHLHIEIDGINRSGSLLVPSTNSPTRFVNNVTGVAILLTQGLHVMRIAFEEGGMALNWIKLNYAGPIDAGSVDAGTTDALAGG